MDRLKVLEVEADYETWRNYGVNKGIHGAILTYLDIKKQDFYVIENTVDGKSYVTARGWEDLSETLYLYEENNFTVDEVLVGQYLRNKRIARNFLPIMTCIRNIKKITVWHRSWQEMQMRMCANVRKMRLLMSVFPCWDCCWMPFRKKSATMSNWKIPCAGYFRS